MPIKRLVVFRFHRDPLVCRTRVDLIRRLNPGVPVHGLFGGPGGARGAAFRLAGRRVLGLDALYVSRHSGPWNWKNGDLVLLDWYRETGHRLSFDVLHFIEWDLLLTEPLERAYAGVPAGAVGLTVPTPLSVIGDDWRWIAGQDEAREWRELLAFARTRYGYGCDDGYDPVPHGCLGDGPCFPRAFLDDYAAADPPALGNDELRYPLFAQLLGYQVVDTGFRRAWHCPADDPYFNAFGDRNIERATIAAELAKPHGRRAFHPVRTPLRGLHSFPVRRSAGGG
ncbi:hypothetical protein [Streptomyces griseorubiginosus]|uniref:Uncharacterized protein n=1 Tax=Streptomyces griseorubiginosus TaxID=67304 RepID=A0A117R3Y3_9ACTN|nr:hypothetical protein [Streptomyces griseorubiginosus]KUN69690.1 hypothetical protein AQJ54_08695 [Streptomyces griseorubiginosus]